MGHPQQIIDTDIKYTPNIKKIKSESNKFIFFPGVFVPEW